MRTTEKAASLHGDAAFIGCTVLGVDPLDHVVRPRLADAHEDRQRSDPTRGDTVRELAHRWSFASPSRFAALYGNACGVSPKWVLDRLTARALPGWIGFIPTVGLKATNVCGQRRRVAAGYSS